MGRFDVGEIRPVGQLFDGTVDRDTAQKLMADYWSEYQERKQEWADNIDAAMDFLLATELYQRDADAPVGFEWAEDYNIWLMHPTLSTYLAITAGFREACNLDDSLLPRYCDKLVELIRKLSKYSLLDYDSAKYPGTHNAVAAMLTGTFGSLLGKAQDNNKIARATVDVAAELLPLKKPASLKGTINGAFMSCVTKSKLLVPHVGVIFEAIKKGDRDLLFALSQIYPHAPEAVEQHLQLLIDIVEEGGRHASSAIPLIGAVAKDKPELVKPHLEVLRSGLDDMTTAASTLMIFNDMASKDAAPFVDMVKDIQTAAKTVVGLNYQACQIYGYVGRVDEEQGKRMLVILNEQLGSGDANLKPIALLAIRNIGEKYKALLEPYIEAIRPLTESANAAESRSAKDIIAFWENRDLESVNKRVDEQEKVVANVEKFVQENMEKMKEFVAGIVKKLPIPCDFTVEKINLGTRVKLMLHFKCGSQKSENCLYKDKTFVCEATQVNKWIKVAFNAIQIGKAAFDGNYGGALVGLKTLWDNANIDYGASFDTFISEPFLKSNEQDELLDNLRSARFFETMRYDAQVGDWCCAVCCPLDKATPAAPGASKAPNSASSQLAPAEDSAAPSASGTVAAVATETSLHGFLWKKSASIFRMGKFQRRFFTFENLELRWSEGEDTPKKRSLHMQNVKNVSPVAKTKFGKDFCFMIVTVNKTYHLYAENQADYDKWIKALEQGLQYAQANKNPEIAEEKKSSSGGLDGDTKAFLAETKEFVTDLVKG